MLQTGFAKGVLSTIHNQVEFILNSPKQSDSSFFKIKTGVYRLDALQFKPSKSQRKVISRFVICGVVNMHFGVVLTNKQMEQICVVWK